MNFTTSGEVWECHPDWFGAASKIDSGYFMPLQLRRASRGSGRSLAGSVGGLVRLARVSAVPNLKREIATSTRRQDSRG